MTVLTDPQNCNCVCSGKSAWRCAALCVVNTDAVFLGISLQLPVLYLRRCFVTSRIYSRITI